MTPDLESLAARVEAFVPGGLPGETTILNTEIYAAIFPDEYAAAVRFNDETGGRGLAAPDFVGSVDQAMRLVPEKQVMNFGTDAKPWANVWIDDESYNGEPFAAWASTPAQSITAAALRAHAALRRRG